jgi:hypothetical protein
MRETFGPSSPLPRQHSAFGGMTLTPMMTAVTYKVKESTTKESESAVDNPLVDEEARFVTSRAYTSPVYVAKT